MLVYYTYLNLLSALLPGMIRFATTPDTAAADAALDVGLLSLTSLCDHPNTSSQLISPSFTGGVVF
jgi:hypothetical protein